MNPSNQEHPLLEKIVVTMVLSAVLAGPPGGMWLGDQLYHLKSYLRGESSVTYEKDKTREGVTGFFRSYNHF